LLLLLFSPFVLIIALVALGLERMGKDVATMEAEDAMQVG
jgi:hypothetical protein